MNINYSDIPENYRDDTKQIVESCLSQGLTITPVKAFNAWSNYSDGYAAGWLGLPYPCTIEGKVFSQEDCDKAIRATVEFWQDKYSFDPEFPDDI
jgi:hypothetical protein